MLFRSIYKGAPWDTDARGPLSQPGVKVKEGDYLLGVNGVPLDTTKDPCAAFLGLADRVVMFEHSVYSVITPEGCAAILWKDGKSPEMRERAATALKITAQDLIEHHVVDEVIPEPPGGAHVDHEATARAVQEALLKHVDELRRLKPDKLVRRRREKFLKIGAVQE